MPTIDQIKRHAEREQETAIETARHAAKLAYEELARPTHDPDIVTGHLLDALMGLGEARGWGNAVHDILNGEIES